jgi:two-component system, response regulator PdtaR
MNSPDRATILIVEDELIVAESLSLDLQRKGYAIAGIVSTGAEAINLAFLTQPDVILMDIMLKGALDGIETSKVIQKQMSIPIIFITAFSDRATLERAKQTKEPLHYLVKPIRLKDLTQRIETILESIGSPKAKCLSVAPAIEPPSGFPSYPTTLPTHRKYKDVDLSFFDISNPDTAQSTQQPSSLFRV